MKTSKTENNQTMRTAPDYVNRVTLVGYLGNAPEQNKGCSVLSLATKRSWKDGDDWKSDLPAPKSEPAVLGAATSSSITSARRKTKRKRMTRYGSDGSHLSKIIHR